MTSEPLTAEKLIERIRRLPAGTQARVREHWPPGVPSLKDPGCTPEHVERVAAIVTRVGGTPTVDEQPDVAAVQALRIRYEALPVDLRALADLAKGDDGLPNLESARTTAAHLQAATPIVADLEDLHRERVKQVCTATTGVGFDDDGRHNLISHVTSGTHTSSKTLTGVEAQKVVDTCTAIELGFVTLTLTAEGEDVVEPVDWKAHAKRLRTNQTDLLGRARTIAETRDDPFPKKLTDVPAGYLSELLGGGGAEPVESAATAAQVEVPVHVEAGECVVVIHRANGITVRNVDAAHPALTALLELEAS